MTTQELYNKVLNIPNRYIVVLETETGESALHTVKVDHERQTLVLSMREDRRIADRRQKKRRRS